MIAYVLYTLFIFSCFILILVVLLQPGKGDVASALGGGVSGAAFGPRGTTTLLAKVTIGAAISFMAIAFVLSVPGLVTDRSVTSGVESPEGQPIDVQPLGEGGEAIPAGQLQIEGGDPSGAPPAEGAQPQQGGQPVPEATPGATDETKPTEGQSP